MVVSRKKAKLTQNKRSASLQNRQLELFDYSSNVDGSIERQLLKTEYINETIFHYPSLKQRTRIKAPTLCDTGTIYRFCTQQVGENCFIDVYRYENEKFSNHQMLRYNIKFHHLIGNGIKQIECTLFSNSSEDIAVAWDAIEDCLSDCSGYATMMDVYGHFTDPHPIFDLRMDILTEKPSFLLQFAQEFSFFEATKKVLPGDFLQKIYVKKQSFELTNIAQMLRKLRFDVRVNETNTAIPPGYFRCCYPVTININKQVSVAWRQRSTQNMVVTSEYSLKLSQAFLQAESLVQADNVDRAILEYKKNNSALAHPLKTIEKNGNEVLLGKTVAEGLETIVNNFGQNKYLYSILITSLVKK